IDAGQIISAPYCARLMADALGAEVIKVEPPGVGDAARRHGPFPRDLPHPEHSGLFQYLNTNKLGVTLNLSDVAGQRIFHRLVAMADILIENYSAVERGRLGLDYERLK